MKIKINDFGTTDTVFIIVIFAVGNDSIVIGFTLS